jgi:hypothetical protein
MADNIVNITFSTSVQGWDGIYLNELFDESLLDNPDEIIINNKKIFVNIDYPLDTKHTFVLRSTNGFSKKKLALMIRDIYKNIYEFDQLTKEKYQIKEGFFGSLHKDAILIGAHFHKDTKTLFIDPNS